jgi:hypothetical protein
MRLQGIIECSTGRWQLAPGAEPTAMTPLGLVRALVERLPIAQYRMLVYLSLADAWIPQRELLSLDGAGDDSTVGSPLLDELDQLGLVRRDDGDRWHVEHEEIAHAVLNDAPLPWRTDLALRLALRQSAAARTVEEARRAVRFYLEADAHAPALDFIKRWHEREQIEMRGRALSEILLGDRADTAFGRAVASAVRTRSRSSRAIVLAIGLTTACLLVTAWQLLTRPARLHVVNSPRIIGNADMGTPPRVQVHDYLGRISRAHDGQTLSLVRVEGIDSITGIDRTPLQDGEVMLDSMRIWGATEVRSTPVTMDVAFPGGPPLRITLSGPQMDSLWLEAGQINGQRLDPVRPSVTIRPRERLRGGLRVRYTEPRGGLLLILAQFTTWRRPVEDTLTIASLIVPADRAFYQQESVDLPGPHTPGEYWLVWTMAFEPAGVWVTSGTSWRCQRPVWEDGNDKSRLPPADLSRAWGSGRIPFWKLDCDDGAPGRFIRLSAPAVAVRVVVR